MNSSQQKQNTFPPNCEIYSFIGGKPEQISSVVYTVLVFIIVFHAASFPFTIVLNLLVIIAVKMKARLQSLSNTALACLASTDVAVGLIVQPVYIFVMKALLNGAATPADCILHVAARFLTNFFCFSSVVHLLLITGERYVAIKHPITYKRTATKARILIASAIAWFLTVALHIVRLINEELFLAINSPLSLTFLAIIVLCNAIVYFITRRHQQRIAVQFSPEARENFLRQKRTLKLFITIVAFVITSYLPVISFRKIKDPLKDVLSLDTLCAIYATTGTLAVLNSFLNPCIYCIRLRQFRVALIELLLRKDRDQAEELENKIFGSNTVANAETNQGGERERNETVSTTVMSSKIRKQTGKGVDRNNVHPLNTLGDNENLREGREKPKHANKSF